MTALTLLSDRTSLAFLCWIIGGEGDDLAQLDRSIDASLSLTALLESGRLMCWRRVEPDTLPEFFSRSAVTVVPSRYEPFGIVALQAMSCGCAVIVSAVGGLQYAAAHRYTGYTIPPNDPEALAWALCGILSGPGLRSVYSENAKAWSKAFTIEETSSLFRRLYRGEAVLPQHPIENPIEYISESRFKCFRPVRAAKEQILSHRYIHHYVEEVDTPCGRKFRKLLNTWPIPDASLFRIDATLCWPTDAEHVSRILFHDKTPWAVPVESFDPDHKLFQFPSLPSARLGAGDLSRLSDLLRCIRGHRRPPAIDAAKMDSAWNRLKERPNRAQLVAFDKSAAFLQTSIFGKPNIFQRVHPGAELLRISIHASERAWPLRQDQIETISRLCESALRLLPVKCPPPALCHGDLAARHVLLGHGRPVLCDFEESRYVVGRFDEAFWLVYEVILTDQAEWPACVIATLNSLLDNRAERGCAVGWIVADLLRRGLWRAIQGHHRDLDRCISRAATFLRGYTMT